MQTIASKIGNTDPTHTVHTFPDQVPINKSGNSQI